MAKRSAASLELRSNSAASFPSGALLPPMASLASFETLFLSRLFFPGRAGDLPGLIGARLVALATPAGIYFSDRISAPLTRNLALAPTLICYQTDCARPTVVGVPWIKAA